MAEAEYTMLEEEGTRYYQETKSNHLMAAALNRSRKLGELQGVKQFLARVTKIS